MSRSTQNLRKQRQEPIRTAAPAELSHKAYQVLTVTMYNESEQAHSRYAACPHCQANTGLSEAGRFDCPKCSRTFRIEILQLQVVQGDKYNYIPCPHCKEGNDVSVHGERKCSSCSKPFKTIPR